MSRIIALRLALLVLPGLGIANTASAHHPPRFERCRIFTYEGQIERIEWRNPHVQIYLRTADGDVMDLGWLNLQALHRVGIEQDTLQVGDRVVVEGGFRPQDVGDEPLWLSHIRRTSDGWEWEQPLQGC